MRRVVDVDGLNDGGRAGRHLVLVANILRLGLALRRRTNRDVILVVVVIGLRVRESALR